MKKSCHRELFSYKICHHFYQSEIDETLLRIQSEHKGIVGVIVTNSEGAIIRSTLNSCGEIVENYNNILTEIVDRAREMTRDNDELTFLKIRTKKIEYIVVPGK